MGLFSPNQAVLARYILFYSLYFISLLFVRFYLLFPSVLNYFPLNRGKNTCRALLYFALSTYNSITCNPSLSLPSSLSISSISLSLFFPLFIKFIFISSFLCFCLFSFFPPSLPLSSFSLPLSHRHFLSLPLSYAFLTFYDDLILEYPSSLSRSLFLISISLPFYVLNVFVV